MQPVMIGAVALIPGQSDLALGLEILVIAVPTWLQITKMIWNARALLRQRPFWNVVDRVGFAEAATLTTHAAGALLVGGVTQGLYVAAAGLLVCILDGVLDAWVLLVEILR
jgi:hypothetical protein